MAKRDGGKKSQSELGGIVDFAHMINDTFEALTGKTIPKWFEEFRQRPGELPPGEEGRSLELVMPLVDAYAILGLKPTATPAEVKKHYRNLARFFHSDKGAMNDEAMKLLNRAHDRITKEVR